MGIKAGNLPISTIDNTDYLMITEGEAPKRVNYADVKNDIIGSETLTQTGKTIKGAINENNASLSDRAKYNNKNANNMIIGIEYLSYYHEKLRNFQPTKLIFSGDSTTFGTGITNENYKIHNLSKIFMENNGANTVTSINAGHESTNTTNWVDTYLAQDLAQNPDLYIIRPGVNDGSNQPFSTRLTVYLTNLRNGLTTIRSQKSADQLSIILMSPNSTNDDANHRNAEWYDLIYPYLVDIAREFECCFVDAYHYMYDSTNVTWQDLCMGDTITHIHPLEVGNVEFVSLLSECLIPTALRNVKNIKSLSPTSGWTIESGYTLTATRIGRKVRVEGSIIGGATAQFTILFYLPEGFKPTIFTVKNAYNSVSNAVYNNTMLVINPDGSVGLVSPATNGQTIIDMELII